MGIRSRETSGWQSPIVGERSDWVVAWGSPEKKLGAGEPRGMAGAAADRWWGVVSGRRGGAGAGGSAGGGWRLRGVQVEDELQALPKLHVKCLSATIAFSFDSSIQIPQ